MSPQAATLTAPRHAGELALRRGQEGGTADGKGRGAEGSSGTQKRQVSGGARRTCWVPGSGDPLFLALTLPASNLDSHQAKSRCLRASGSAQARPSDLQSRYPARDPRASPCSRLGARPPAVRLHRSPAAVSRGHAAAFRPTPCPAYPPARLFGCAGGGRAGRRGRFGSPRPRHALPAQGPPGAGPRPVVIPGRARTQARARAQALPRPTGPTSGRAAFAEARCSTSQPARGTRRIAIARARKHAPFSDQRLDPHRSAPGWVLRVGFSLVMLGPFCIPLPQ